MYRAVKLAPEDKDLHRFVWQEALTKPLVDYRMTRITFGVSASSFAANMSVKQNALDFAHEYPLVAKITLSSFYVDDCLTGADTIAEAVKIQKQLQSLFSRGGFLLRKWHSSNPAVLNSIPHELKDPDPQTITIDADPCNKALGIVWNNVSDTLTISIPSLPSLSSQVELTKKTLVSDVAKTFDILVWFSPTMIIAKILLQRCWERRIDWDDPVPPDISNTWYTWKSELHLMAEFNISCYYFNGITEIALTELHGFCDASESTYAAVIYLRATSSHGCIQSTLIISKTKVAPLKRLTIPRLELCGAKLLAQLLHDTSKALEIPLSHVYAWCDSTIVLSWLDGSPRKFKTFVGNRVSVIMDLIPPNHWRYVPTGENPADCASRGLLPLELITHSIWWTGPEWLRQSSDKWPHYPRPLSPFQKKKKKSSSQLARFKMNHLFHLKGTQTSRSSTVSLPGS